jgi:RNA polymerase sigma-70 factor (ECF subfamily)
MRNDLVGPNPIVSTSWPAPSNGHNSDEALIAKIASGNRLAMQVLYARHHTRVYRFILRLVGNDAFAEDLTSEVFLSVWRQAHRFEARSAVTTWLLAIARYKAIAELRRRPMVSPDDENADISDPADDPEVTLQGKHRAEILRRCLTQLTPEHREIIDLVYYHEKSVQEVAEIVGIPGNTVKTRMFYARKKLSELLQLQGVVGAFS